jgi:restriction system protein
MLPLLNLAADGKEHRLRAAIEELADHFNLTDDERKELLPSGSQATFDNRVGWARTYMKKAGLLESPRRGYFQITDQGIQALEQKPEMINVKFLERYPEFLEFKTKSNTKSTTTEIDTTVPTEERTPREVMEDAYVTIRSGLVGELREQIMDSSPSFFERLVVDLLVRMGYGGTRQEAGRPLEGAAMRGSTGSLMKTA